MKNDRLTKPKSKEHAKLIADIINHVSQPMIVTSADRRLLYWNAAFRKLIGYNDKELSDPIISAGLTAPEWQESENKALDRLAHTGKSQTFQKEYIRKDGSRVPVEVLIYQLTEGNGKARYYIGLITDITELKRLEEVRRESEERYRSLVQLSPDAIIVASEGKHVFVNDAGVKLLGASSPGQIIGKSITEFIRPDYRKVAAERMRQVIETGTAVPYVEEKFVRIDGSEIDVEVGGSPLVFQGKPAIQAVIRDISPRKRTEEALKKSEDKYRIILDEIQNGYFEVDLAGNFTFANKAFCYYTGYSPGELMRLDYKHTTPPEEVDNVFHWFNQVYKTGVQVQNFDSKYKRKDGSIGFVEFVINPMRNTKGDIIGFRGVTHDITERVEMEDSLKQSEEKYRRILEQMRESYFELDLAGRFTFFNDSLCRGLGYSREELMGMSYKVYTPPEEVEKAFQAYNQVYRTGEPLNLFSLEQLRKDGEKIFVENSIAPIRNENGEIVGFRGISRNITERVQAEQALRRSEERYRTIMDQMQDDYFELDLAGNYTFVNDALCRSAGYTCEELIGKNYRITTTDADNPRIFQAFNQVYRTGQPLRSLTIAFVRKDGGLGVAEMTAFPMRNEKGEITGFRGVSHDITERKQMEEAIRQSEKRYRTILEDMQESYFEVDLKGHYTLFNDAQCRQVGYSREEMLGMSYKTITPADKQKDVFEIYNRIYRTGEPSELFRAEQIRKDGIRIPVEYSALPIVNDNGEIIGFRGVGHDITERVEMENALRRSEERYRTILEDMEESYYENDLAGNFIFVNDAVCRQLGYSKQELIGMNYRAYTSPEDIQKVFQIYNQVYLTGKPNRLFTTRQIRKDGKSIVAENSAIPIRNENGEIIGFRGVAHEVTARLHMEEALRRSEERYRTLLEEMDEPYYEDDLAGKFVFVNDALCRTMGYSREELIGMDFKVYTPPEQVKQVFKAYNQVYRTGEPIKLFTRDTISKDGRRIPVETSILPIKNEKGEVTGFRGISRDISQRKKAEEERRQLEHKAQLASRLASVGELASGVAHEINNPLTGVIGYAHLLLTRKDISRDVRHDLEIINEGAQRVAGIVKKLLAFARQTKPEHRYININELVGNTLDLRAYELSASNIKVTLQLGRDMPMTIADPGQLQQVFLNLIINAETEMKLAHDKGRLTIKTERMNNTLRISFKDTGPGIAKENLETIFDPFFTTREVGQGTGLGLSVCHGIVTEHKGKIWAESEKGKGATFIIELPLVTEEGQVESSEPVVENLAKVAKSKILVVDDEPVIRQFISQVLGEQGHTVETVDNAAAALKMVRSKRYRLILLDIKMPGMSGVELYKQFQKIAPSLTKRVVFITGDVMGKRTISFLNKTNTPYMMKPFDAKELKTEINRVLSKK